MSAANYQFIQTYDLFSDYLSRYPKNPTFEEWNNAEADDKACLLYVAFFPQIAMAWNNAIVARNIAYVTQEDGVSTVLQYLMKNVDIISANPNRYTTSYIYQIAYNCICCLPRALSEQARNACDTPNEYIDGEVSVNLWDLVPSEDDDVETQQTKEAIWTIIRHMGPKAEKVVNHLINPTDTLHKISKSSPERPLDRLADVSVSKSEYDAILAELRVQLAPYKDLLLHF